MLPHGGCPPSAMFFYLSNKQEMLLELALCSIGSPRYARCKVFTKQFVNRMNLWKKVLAGKSVGFKLTAIEL